MQAMWNKLSNVVYTCPTGLLYLCFFQLQNQRYGELHSLTSRRTWAHRAQSTFLSQSLHCTWPVLLEYSSSLPSCTFPKLFASYMVHGIWYVYRQETYFWLSTASVTWQTGLGVCIFQNTVLLIIMNSLEIPTALKEREGIVFTIESDVENFQWWILEWGEGRWGKVTSLFI